MLKPVSRITIYQSTDKQSEINEIPNYKPMVFQFYSYQSINIDKSWENLTQKAQVVIPRRIKYIPYSHYTFNDFDLMDPKTDTLEIENGLLKNYITKDEALINWRQKRIDKNNKLYFVTSDNKTMWEFTRSANKVGEEASNKRLLSYINDYNLIFKQEETSTYKEANGGTVRVNPLIQRGDMIIIELGYLIDDKKGYRKFVTYETGNLYVGNSPLQEKLPKELQEESDLIVSGNKQKNIDNRWKPSNRGKVFIGYISKTSINADGNIVFDCEDLMYLYNRARIPNGTYDPNDAKAKDYDTDETTKGWTLNNIIYDMLAKIKNSETLPRSVIPPNFAGIAKSALDTFFNIKSSIKCSPHYKYKLCWPYIKGLVATIDLSYNIDMSGLGTIQIDNATIGQVLQWLKDNYLLQIYFKPRTDILHATPFVYNDQRKPDGTIVEYDATKSPDENLGTLGQNEFTFITGNWTENGEYLAMDSGLLPKKPSGYYKNKQNIIRTNFEFRRVEDQLVGAIVKSNYMTDMKPETSGVHTTKDNRKKKDLNEISVLAGDVGGLQMTFMYLVSSGSPDFKKISTNGKLDVNKLKKEMYNYGLQLLSRYHYSGLYGSFTIMGYPYVEFSDIVNIVDLQFPEKSGRYYVKRVIYKADQTEGLTQEIFLDYKIPTKKNRFK